MKKIFLFGSLMALFAVAANAQDAGFSGKWVLDRSQSKLDERSRIESMTVTIEHKGNAFSRTTERKDAPRPDGRPGAAGRGGAFGLGTGREDLTLDGEEKKSSMETPMGPAPVSTKAETNEDGSITITTVRTFNGPSGEMQVTTIETLSLSDGGATMTIVSEMQGPRPSKSELVFKKN